jgi:hypothetical protein
MQDIEQKISPLIENMFPSFYRDEGPSFVMFVKAYYEWLETNHQVIQLEDNTNFNVGDIITQDNVTGTIVAFVGTDLLVKVDGLETFKCFGMCSELIPVTSSSGGNTYILRGGATRRLGSIFMSRNLPSIRDIDTTLDIFITQFKEKYLKNIEFDTETNKRMLVKNSLDLYRSKGTSRSIDLFFRLVYGYNSQVVYPGDNLFKLSEGSWVKPRYIEITGSNPQRAIALVGSAIRGITSGAEAFVERYIKRKVNNGFVHILYLTNVQGEFVNRETIYHKSQTPFSDSPRVLGSLTSVDIVTGSRDFAVGDIVSFITETGDYGKARVSSVFDDERGVVEFILLDGGYGYSVSSGVSTEQLADRTQSLVSDNTILVTNVHTSNSIADLRILSAGVNYSNTDIITITSEYGSAEFRPETTLGGTIRNVALMKQSGGFFGDQYSVGIASPSGIGASLQPIFKESYSDSYFKIFEELKQNSVTIEYGGIANGAQFSVGNVIRIANSTSYDVAYGEIIDNSPNPAYSNGEIIMMVANNYMTVVGDSIYQIANSTISASVDAVEDTSALGSVLDVSTTGSLEFEKLIGSIVKYDEIYQLNDEGIEIGRATVSSLTLNKTTGVLNFSNLQGFFRIGKPFNVAGNEETTAVVSNVTLSVSVYGTDNDYSASSISKIHGTQTGTVAEIVSVGGGRDASFKVSTLSETETIQINRDLVSSTNYAISSANQVFLDVALNATEFGFTANRSGNVSSSLFSCFSFANLAIGTIKTISDINPGDNYASSPIVKVYQPYVANYNYTDYKFTVKDATNSYVVGEQVIQSIPDLRYNIVATNPLAFRIGEKVYQPTGVMGTVFSVGNPTANVIVINEVSNGVFVTTENIYSYNSLARYTEVNSVSSVTVPTQAKGLVVATEDDKVYVKRQQFKNKFELNKTLTGGATGVTANLIQIETFTGRLPIGFNGQVEGSAYSADGVITSLQVIDSGYGYSNNQSLVYTSEDGSRSGTARAIVEGVGTGSGYYKTSKGFLSNISKIHDGDYYQEYSYDVMSRLPLDKYADMFKKVMHTAGTRFFGTVVVDTVSNTNVRIANSSFEILPVSPLTVEDRRSIYVQDRGRNFVEIRD